MTVVRPPMTNFKMIIRADNAASACNSLPLSIKLLPTDCQGGVSLWTQICPLPRLLAFKIKQIFLFTNLAS